MERERLAKVQERAAKICEYERLRREEERTVAEVARTNAQPLTRPHRNRSFLVNYQLSELENALDATFFRARRSILVNPSRVKEFRRYSKSSFLLIMSDAAGTEIQVSERQAKLQLQRIRVYEASGAPTTPNVRTAREISA